MIRLAKLHRRYPPDREVLRGVDLEVGKGEFVAIFGRSGSGKTTLLNIVGGLDSEFEGSVEVAGVPLSELGDRRLSRLRNRTIGFVFQAYHLLEHLRVGENAALPAVFSRGEIAEPGLDLVRRTREVLESVGLGDRIGDRPTNLSGGERQRLAIARALFLGPDILLCDEPTGNLDSETGAELIDLLQRIHRDHGTTILAATHDPALSITAGRVLRLRDGVLAEERPRDGAVP